MAREFDEGHLRFSFDDSWHVEKWDDHRDYREGLCRLEGSKAVDMVGVPGSGDAYLIEIKDFRGYRIENRSRFGGELEREVAKKVRDTVAGILASYRRSGEHHLWEPLVQAFADRNRRIRIVLWVEDDVARNEWRWRQCASVITKQLKRELSWLTTSVLVCNLQVPNQPPGLTVANLPGAGGE